MVLVYCYVVGKLARCAPKSTALSMSLIAQFESSFFRGGNVVGLRRIFLVAFQKEQFLTEKEAVYFSNDSLRSSANIFFVLSARLLNMFLSEGSLVFCQVDLARRFKEMRSRAKIGSGIE